MTLAEQLEALEGKGFSAEQARVIVLMREAATILFREWPERFILYGGASLVLFHRERQTFRRPRSPFGRGLAFGRESG
jgi:hypothetical protein